MNKKNSGETTRGRVRKSTNRGGATFNQGSQQSDEAQRQVAIPDEEKRTGHNQDKGHPRKKS